MENYRISPKGKSALCEAVVVLTESQLEKLENPELLPRIEAAAKDLHVDFSVEKNGNVALCIIGTTQKWPVDSTDMHNAQINAINFMSFVDDLEVENDENVSTEEEAETTIDRIEFCRNALNNMHKTDDLHIVGAKLVISHPRLPFAFLEGCISKQLLMECFELYLEKYDHEQD